MLFHFLLGGKGNVERLISIFAKNEFTKYYNVNVSLRPKNQDQLDHNPSLSRSQSLQ